MGIKSCLGFKMFFINLVQIRFVVQEFMKTTEDSIPIGINTSFGVSGSDKCDQQPEQPAPSTQSPPQHDQLSPNPTSVNIELSPNSSSAGKKIRMNKNVCFQRNSFKSIWKKINFLLKYLFFINKIN